MRMLDAALVGETRQRTRRGALFVACILALAGLVISSDGASAAEVRSGDSPSVENDETVTGDLYLFGGTVDIDGRVLGDAIVATGRLNVSDRPDGKSSIAGSLSVLAGKADIKGGVDGSVRVAGGDVKISGDVGGDVVVAGGKVTIESAANVAGDLIVGGGDVSVLGPVGGDVRGNVGSLTINARIGGDVDVRADDLRLRSKTRIAGNLDYTSREEAQRELGASVTGTTRHQEPARFYPGDNLASWFGSAIFRLLCALVAGLAIVLLVPRAAAVVADGIRGSPIGSFLVGLALLVFVPILALILLITVVGIPIALILIAAYVCVLYLSQVFLGLAIGRVILPDSWDTNGRGYNLLAMTIGVVIIAGLRLIPLPFVSGVIALITVIFGLGAVILGPRRMRARSGAFPQY